MNVRLYMTANPLLLNGSSNTPETPMRPIKTSTLYLSLFLALSPVAPLSVLTAPTASAATPADTAKQVRDNWAKTRQAYLDSVQPYAGQPAHAALIKQYTEALDKTGAALENYLNLKLATPAAPAAKLTPAVDLLIKSLTALRSLRGKATGPLVNVLGSALGQQNEVAQTALKNMR